MWLSHWGPIRSTESQQSLSVRQHECVAEPPVDRQRRQRKARVVPLACFAVCFVAAHPSLFACSAATRLDGGGARVEVWSGSVWVGQGRTNNEAEYSGLIEGLRAAKELGVKVSFAPRAGTKQSYLEWWGGAYKALPYRRLAEGVSCPVLLLFGACPGEAFVFIYFRRSGSTGIYLCIVPPCCLLTQNARADFASRSAARVSYSGADVCLRSSFFTPCCFDECDEPAGSGNYPKRDEVSPPRRRVVCFWDGYAVHVICW